MAIYLALLAVLGGGVLHKTTAAPTKCDPKIISGIKEIWGDNIPRNIVKTAVKDDWEVVVGLTVPLPEGSKCSYSFYIDNNVFSLTKVNTKGTSVTKNIPIYESDGVIIEKDRAVKRYYVLAENGVTATYKCYDIGVEGVPEGTIKVRQAGYDKNTVLKAKKLLQRLGISIDHEYQDNCASIRDQGGPYPQEGRPYWRDL